MNRYRFCDATVDSDLPLPLAKFDDSARPKWRCLLSDPPFDESNQWVWLHHWSFTGGDLALALGTNGSEYLFRFPDQADFVVSPASSEIECRPKRATRKSTLIQLLLHQVLPRALSHGGRLIVHASSVLVTGGAMVFLGSSEAGKSTLASYFAESGSPLLSDDCLMLKGSNGGDWTAVPSYPGPKKIRFHTEPVRVHKVCALGPPADNTDPEHRIERMTASAGMMSVVSGAFLLDLESPTHLQRVFELAGELAASVPIYQLHFRRTYRALPELGRAILDHAQGSG